MLHLSVLNFYGLLAKIFIPKSGFVICLLMETTTFYQLFSIHNLWLNTPCVKKRSVMETNLTFHEANVFSLLNVGLDIFLKKLLKLKAKQNIVMLDNTS